MDILIKLAIICCTLLIGFVSTRVKKPQRVYLKYGSIYKWYDLIINVLGSWIFLFLTGMVHTRTMELGISSNTSTFFSKSVTFFILHFYLTRSIQRTTHPGLFCLPTSMNVLATMAQVEALGYVAFPEFAVAKTLRLSVVAIYEAKDAFWWSCTAGIAAYFMFLIEVNDEVWVIPKYTGIMWLAIFVLSDTLTVITQQEIFEKFQVTSPTMMYYINGILALTVVPLILLETPQKTVNDCMYHLILLLVFTVLSAITQFFTLRLIRQFGALTFAAVCVVRNVLTLSVGKFMMHGELDMHEYAELAVFAALLIILSRRRHNDEDTELSLGMSTPIKT